MDELSSGFTDFGLSLDMQLLQRINDIRCQHGFSVEDIIDEWIAFSENHQVKEVTDSTVEMFENKVYSYCDLVLIFTFPHVLLHACCSKS
jgi:hypothetical protein